MGSIFLLSSYSGPLDGSETKHAIKRDYQYHPGQLTGYPQDHIQDSRVLYSPHFSNQTAQTGSHYFLYNSATQEKAIVMKHGRLRLELTDDLYPMLKSRYYHHYF